MCWHVFLTLIYCSLSCHFSQTEDHLGHLDWRTQQLKKLKYKSWVAYPNNFVQIILAKIQHNYCRQISEQHSRSKVLVKVSHTRITFANFSSEITLPTVYLQLNLLKDLTKDSLEHQHKYKSIKSITFVLDKHLRLNVTFAVLKFLTGFRFSPIIQNLYVVKISSGIVSCSKGQHFKFYGIFSQFSLYPGFTTTCMKAGHKGWQYMTEVKAQISVISENIIKNYAVSSTNKELSTKHLIIVSNSIVLSFHLQVKKNFRIVLNITTENKITVVGFNGPGIKSPKFHTTNFVTETFQCLIQTIASKEIATPSFKNLVQFGEKEVLKRDIQIDHDAKIIHQANNTKETITQYFNLISVQQTAINVTLTHFTYQGEQNEECNFGGLVLMQSIHGFLEESLSLCSKGNGNETFAEPRHIYCENMSMLFVFSYRFYSQVSLRVFGSTTVCKVKAINPCEYEMKSILSGTPASANIFTGTYSCFALEISMNRNFIKETIGMWIRSIDRKPLVCTINFMLSETAARPSIFKMAVRAFLQSSDFSKIQTTNVFGNMKQIKAAERGKTSQPKNFVLNINSEQGDRLFSMNLRYAVPSLEDKYVSFLFDRWTFNHANVLITKSNFTFESKTVFLLKRQITHSWQEIDTKDSNMRFSVLDTQLKNSNQSLFVKAFTFSSLGRLKYKSETVLELNWHHHLLFNHYVAIPGTLRKLHVKVNSSSTSAILTISWIGLNMAAYAYGITVKNLTSKILCNFTLRRIGYQKSCTNYLFQYIRLSMKGTYQILKIMQQGKKVKLMRSEPLHSFCKAQAVSWREASDLCKQNLGHLPEIFSRNEQEEILSLAKTFGDLLIDALYLGNLR